MGVALEKVKGCLQDETRENQPIREAKREKSEQANMIKEREENEIKGDKKSQHRQQGVWPT